MEMISKFYNHACDQIGGTPGAGSMDECIPCPAGTAVNLATAGYAGPENCVNCQPGSFRIEWKTRLAAAYDSLIGI